MASREDAAKALKAELDKAQSVRGDETAWKAQVKNVQKADRAHQQAIRQERGRGR